MSDFFHSGWPYAAGAAGCVGAGYAAWSVLAPGSQTFIPVIRRLPVVNAVALTFDDGPTEPFTARILDILAEHHAQATFFLIGQNVRKYPKLARRIVEEGHTVGNHSYDHTALGFTLGQRYWHSQLARTNRVITHETGLRPRLFRAPRGIKFWPMARALKRKGMRVVGWRLRGFDTVVGPGFLTGYLTRRMRAGDIITLHDGLEKARREKSQQGTVDALPAILRSVQERKWHCFSLAQGLDTPVYFAHDDA